MTFYSGVFLYLLFAGSVVFWLIPGQRLRTWFLIASSGAALLWVQPQFTLFLLGLIAFVHFAARLVQGGRRTDLFTVLLIALTLVLLGFKYGAILFAAVFAEETKFAQSYLVPIGISYLSFKLIAYVIDTYRGEIEDPRLDDLLAFILFLPIFPAGPIERFQRFADQRRPTFDLEHYLSGLRRILLGFFKKIVIVGYLVNTVVFERLAPRITDAAVDPTALAILGFLVGALIYAYLDLSAYADIAIGFGQLFGYQIYENMNYPLFRRNLSEYWNNWHMSLSHWCRNYVYFPVIGWTRNSTLALYSSFIVMGLWHQVNLNWLLWGLWHASGIAVYSRWSRWSRKQFKGRDLIPGPVGYAVGMTMTVVYSGLGFAFITQPTASDALNLLMALIV